MMRINRKVLLLVGLITAALGGSPAVAGQHLTLFGGIQQTGVSGDVSGSPFSSQRGTQYGAMMVLDGPPITNVSFGKSGFTFSFGLPFSVGAELGTILLNRKYGESNGASITAPFAQIPLYGRITFAQVFTLGFGGYYAKYIGGGEGIPSGAGSPGESWLQRREEYGFSGFARVSFFPASFIGISTDVRTNIAGNNASRTGNFKFRDTAVVAGIRIGRAD